MDNKADEIRKGVQQKIEEAHRNEPKKTVEKPVETTNEQKKYTASTPGAVQAEEKEDKLSSKIGQKTADTENLTPTEIGDLKKAEEEKEDSAEDDFLHLQDPTKIGNRNQNNENDANAEKNKKKIARGDREKPDEDGFDKDKSAIFQEGDIIQYMFKEWLLKGADWCVNTVINYGIIPITYESGRAVCNWVSEGVEDIKEYTSDSKNKTQTFANKVKREHKDYAKTSNQMINDPAIDTLVEELGAEFREGRVETIKKLLPDMYAAFKDVPPEVLQERMSPENLKKLTTSIKIMCAARAQFTANMAATRLLHEKASNVNRFKEKDDEPDQTANHFTEYRLQARKDFDAIFQKALKEGHRPDEVINQALKLSGKAYTQEQKNIKNGKYVENHNSQPGPNEALEKVEAMIKPDKTNAEVKTIAEAGHETSASAGELVNLIENGNLLEFRNQLNQERRELLNRTKSKIAGNDNADKSNQNQQSPDRQTPTKGGRE